MGLDELATNRDNAPPPYNHAHINQAYITNDITPHYCTVDDPTYVDIRASQMTQPDQNHLIISDYTSLDKKLPDSFPLPPPRYHPNPPGDDGYLRFQSIRSGSQPPAVAPKPN